MVAILLAPRWLRQKIIWQKASIPYLFRLADAAPTIGDRCQIASSHRRRCAAEHPPCQVVIGGPIGSAELPWRRASGPSLHSNKTKCGISVSIACSNSPRTRRHRSFPDDPGPTTISYWPWSQAQVVIIDGIGPMIAADEPGREANLAV